MSSVLDHPAATLARASVRSVPWPPLARPRARGPLGAPFDPFAAETLADRHAVYRRLHASPGVHPVSGRTYALASYDDVRAGARAHDTLISGKGVTMLGAGLPMLLTIDRPRHADLRRMLAPHFTGARSAAMEEGMREIASDAIDRMLARRRSDAIKELAVPLPLTVIARLLGVPESDIDRLHTISDGIVEGFHFNGILNGTRAGITSLTNALALHRYMTPVFARLRRSPGDDVLSDLLSSQDGGDLSDEELFWLSLLLIVAGNETTTNLIGLLLHALANDPESYERLRAEPELIGPCIDEGLRWGSPIQEMFRTVTSDYTVGHTTIPGGARVALLFGAANRDPRRFENPDDFVLDREPEHHLGFGFGIHFCLGAHLARVEARVVLEELTARVARIEPAARVRWRANPAVYGPSRLPLRLEAA